MSWLAQVGHVLKKDVRQHRWMILVVLVALGGAVVEAMGGTVASAPQPFTSLLSAIRTVTGAGTLLVASVFLVAFLVQGDSPARSDAFWVPRPLSPSAVFAAKVTLVGFLAVLLPLVWEVLAVGSHHLWSGRVIGVLGRSLLTQLGLLAAVAVVASLTRDLRTFIVAFLVVTVGWAMALGAVQRAVPGQAVGGIATPVVAVAALLGSLALVAYQYRVRDVGRTLRVFAVPALLTLGLGVATADWRFAPGPTSAPELSGQDLRIRSIVLKSPPSWSGRHDVEAHVHVQLVGGQSDHRYTFIWSRLRVRWADGSESTFPGRGGGGSVGGPPVVLAGLSWLGRDPTAERRVSWTEMAFLVPANKVTAITDPRSRFAMEGQILVDAPLDVGPIPLRPGATVVGNGRRFQILAVGDDQRHPRIALHMEGLESATGVGFLSWFDFTLVNPTLQQAMEVRQSPTFGEYEHLSHGMVFMGDSWSTTAGSLVHATGIGSTAVEPPAVDDAWLAGAQLHITDWAREGSYRVSTTPMEVEVRQQRGDSDAPVASPATPHPLLAPVPAGAGAAS